MRSFTFFAAAALAAVASAASTENAFNNPEGGYKFTAGKSTTLKWSPDTDGTVSLRLQTGKTTTSTSGTEIACESNASPVVCFHALTRVCSQHQEQRQLHLGCPL